MVAGAEAWGTHAAVGDKGDTQVVGVGVEGRRGHIAAKSGGTRRGRQCSLPEMVPPPYCTTTKPGCKGVYLDGPPRAGAGSVPPAPCSS